MFSWKWFSKLEDKLKSFLLFRRQIRFINRSRPLLPITCFITFLTCSIPSSIGSLESEIKEVIFQIDIRNVLEFTEKIEVCKGSIWIQRISWYICMLAKMAPRGVTLCFYTPSIWLLSISRSGFKSIIKNYSI